MYRITTIALVAMALAGSTFMIVAPSSSFAQDAKPNTEDHDGGKLERDTVAEAASKVEIVPLNAGRVFDDPDANSSESERRSVSRMERREAKIERIRHSANQ